jgi:hypothetical protein
MKKSPNLLLVCLLGWPRLKPSLLKRREWVKVSFLGSMRDRRSLHQNLIGSHHSLVVAPDTSEPRFSTKELSSTTPPVGSDLVIWAIASGSKDDLLMQEPAARVMEEARRDFESVIVQDP